MYLTLSFLNTKDLHIFNVSLEHSLAWTAFAETALLSKQDIIRRLRDGAMGENSDSSQN